MSSSMRSEECIMSGVMTLKRGLSRPDLARWLLSSIPTASGIEYFSVSERLRRSPEFEIANSKALDRYLDSRLSYYFHSRAYEMSIGTSLDDSNEIGLSGRSLLPVCELLETLIPILDGKRLTLRHRWHT